MKIGTRVRLRKVIKISDKWPDLDYQVGALGWVVPNEGPRPWRPWVLWDGDGDPIECYPSEIEATLPETPETAEPPC